MLIEQSTRMKSWNWNKNTQKLMFTDLIPVMTGPLCLMQHVNIPFKVEQKCNMGKNRD